MPDVEYCKPPPSGLFAAFHCDLNFDILTPKYESLISVTTWTNIKFDEELFKI